MATLLLDIETVGIHWYDFDTATKAYFQQQALTFGNTIEQLQSSFALSAFTGTIVSLSIYDLERAQGVAYVVGNQNMTETMIGAYTLKDRTEKELLEDFWDGARSYDTFVTFGGRGFDIPFLLHRSLLCGVRPTINLLGARYVSKQTLPYHIDLQDEFSFYGAISRPSLQLMCLRHGIEYVHSNDRGKQAAELLSRQCYAEIAEHTMSRVMSIRTLYEMWKHYLAPNHFLNATEF
jgi:3'-5' exonuclease